MGGDCQLGYRWQSARTKIDRRRDEPVAIHDLVDAQHTIVDETEAARLRAVAPDLDSHVARILGLARGAQVVKMADPRPGDEPTPSGDHDRVVKIKIAVDLHFRVAFHAWMADSVNDKHYTFGGCDGPGSDGEL